MKYIAHIDIMPHSELLDPQGKALERHLPQISSLEKVRVGKHIKIWLDADHLDEAKAQVEDACNNLLANAIMETYTFRLESMEVVS